MWWGQNKTKTKRKQHSSRFTPISQKRKAFIHRRDLTSDWCRSWTSKTLATWCKELTHWKSPWCWERLKAGGEGDDRGGDGWMVSPTQWTWVWVKSRVGDGQGSLACYSPWGWKEPYMTEWLNLRKGKIIRKSCQLHTAVSKIILEQSTLKVCLNWSEWPSSKNLKTINAGESGEKRQPSCTIGGNVNWYSHYGEQYRDSLKNWE